jgi:hypothetical protein
LNPIVIVPASTNSGGKLKKWNHFWGNKGNKTKKGK